MFIIGDLLLFTTTALVLSITCLCVLLHVRSKDAYTRGFLTVLVPLCLQMCLNMLVTYIHRVYADQFLTGTLYEVFCLWITFVSILLTTALLLAMNLTFGYHFFSASMLMTAFGLTALFYRKKSETWAQESLLNGISISFLPLLVTFPLDLIFFQSHSFKLAYLSFSVFVVYLYFFISRQYFQTIDVQVDSLEIDDATCKSYGISVREAQIIQLLVTGRTNHEIAESLYISENTVKTHVKNIYAKLKVSNRVQLFTLFNQKR
jgi:DNA-binding CsgD family transcriptional regulator